MGFFKHLVRDGTERNRLGFIGVEIFIDHPFEIVPLALPDLKKPDTEHPIANPTNLRLLDHDGSRTRDHQCDRHILAGIDG